MRIPISETKIADELWPILLVVVLLFLMGTLRIFTGAIRDAMHILCPDPSNPFTRAITNISTIVIELDLCRWAGFSR